MRFLRLNSVSTDKHLEFFICSQLKMIKFTQSIGEPNKSIENMLRYLLSFIYLMIHLDMRRHWFLRYIGFQLEMPTPPHGRCYMTSMFRLIRKRLSDGMQILIIICVDFAYLTCMILGTSQFIGCCIYLEAMCEHFDAIMQTVQAKVEQNQREKNPRKIEQTNAEINTQMCKAVEIHITIKEWVDQIKFEVMKYGWFYGKKFVFNFNLCII